MENRQWTRIDANQSRNLGCFGLAPVSIRVHSRAFAVDPNSYEIFTRFLRAYSDRGTWNVFELKCSDPLAQRVGSWRNLQVAPWCIYSRSGTAARMLNRPVPVRRSAALLIGPWMRYLASPHLTLSLCVYRGGRAHTSRVVFAPLPNTRSRRRGRRPVQSRRLRSPDAKHVSRFAGRLQSPIRDDRK